MSKFNHKEFEEKIDNFKKTMEEIGAASKKISEDAKKLKEDLVLNQVNEVAKKVKIDEPEKPIDLGTVKDHIMYNNQTYTYANPNWKKAEPWWYEQEVKKPIVSIDPGSDNGSISVHSWDGTKLEQEKPKEGASTTMPPASQPKKFDWPVTKTVKQNFNPITVYASGGWSGPSYHNYFIDELIHDEELGKEQLFKEELIKTVNFLVSFVDETADITKSPGKHGEARFKPSQTFKDSVVAYVWYVYTNSWIQVDYKQLMNFWTDKQAKKWKKQDENPWAINEYDYPVTPPPLEMMPESLKVKKAEPMPYLQKPKIQNTVPEKITKIVKQKTKPSKPFQGLAWYATETGDTKLYDEGQWKSIDYTDLNTASVLMQKKTTAKIDANKEKKTETGYWYRANCSHWHKVINPENTVFKSANGKHTWFFSPVSADKEYDCQHDHKRVMPVFTYEEKVEKLKEIQAKQNGEDSSQFFIQIANDSKKNFQFEEVYSKQTIKVGSRAFHHNSGTKTWYICLTYDEMLALKSHSDAKLESLQEDIGNIFADAIPNSKWGYAWFLDGTREVKTKQGMLELAIANKLQEVQNIADKLDYEKFGAKKKKPLEKENITITKTSSYCLDPGDYMAYLAPFDYPLEDECYSFGQLKAKAQQIHKYVMTDLKIASLKKDKKRFEECENVLQLLQEKFQKVEAYYVEHNLGKPHWMKPLSKIHNLWNYHFDNTYGVE